MDSAGRNLSMAPVRFRLANTRLAAAARRRFLTNYLTHSCLGGDTRGAADTRKTVLPPHINPGVLVSVRLVLHDAPSIFGVASLGRRSMSMNLWRSMSTLAARSRAHKESVLGTTVVGRSPKSKPVPHKLALSFITWVAVQASYPSNGL